jgi:DNA-binding transcriptional ArsR family regulator
MVNYQGRLDHTFMALADPTRRAILAQLERRDGASISELAKPFTILLPAVMKHLDVTNDSGRAASTGLRPMPRAKRPKREGKTDDESHTGTPH